MTANLVRCLLRDERRVLTVSRVQDGTAGVEGVALSLPATVGSGGARTVLTPQMDVSERSALARSAEVLRAARAQLN